MMDIADLVIQAHVDTMTTADTREAEQLNPKPATTTKQIQSFRAELAALAASRHRQLLDLKRSTTATSSPRVPVSASTSTTTTTTIPVIGTPTDSPRALRARTISNQQQKGHLQESPEDRVNQNIPPDNPRRRRSQQTSAASVASNHSGSHQPSGCSQAEPRLATTSATTTTNITTNISTNTTDTAPESFEPDYSVEFDPEIGSPPEPPSSIPPSSRSAKRKRSRVERDLTPSRNILAQQPSHRSSTLSNLQPSISTTAVTKDTNGPPSSAAPTPAAANLRAIKLRINSNADVIPLLHEHLRKQLDPSGQSDIPKQLWNFLRRIKVPVPFKTTIGSISNDTRTELLRIMATSINQNHFSDLRLYIDLPKPAMSTLVNLHRWTNPYTKPMGRMTADEITTLRQEIADMHLLGKVEYAKKKILDDVAIWFEHNLVEDWTIQDLLIVFASLICRGSSFEIPLMPAEDIIARPRPAPAPVLAKRPDPVPLRVIWPAPEPMYASLSAPAVASSSTPTPASISSPSTIPAPAPMSASIPFPIPEPPREAPTEPTETPPSIKQNDSNWIVTDKALEQIQKLKLSLPIDTPIASLSGHQINQIVMKLTRMHTKAIRVFWPSHNHNLPQIAQVSLTAIKRRLLPNHKPLGTPRRELTPRETRIFNHDIAIIARDGLNAYAIQRTIRHVPFWLKHPDCAQWTILNLIIVFCLVRLRVYRFSCDRKAQHHKSFRKLAHLYHLRRADGEDYHTHDGDSDTYLANLQSPNGDDMVTGNSSHVAGVSDQDASTQNRSMSNPKSSITVVYIVNMDEDPADISDFDTDDVDLDEGDHAAMAVGHHITVGQAQSIDHHDVDTACRNSGNDFMSVSAACQSLLSRGLVDPTRSRRDTVCQTVQSDGMNTSVLCVTTVSTTPTITTDLNYNQVTSTGTHHSSVAMDRRQPLVNHVMLDTSNVETNIVQADVTMLGLDSHNHTSINHV